MAVKDRLSRLRTQAGAGANTPAPKPSLSTLRARIAQLEKRRSARPGATSAETLSQARSNAVAFAPEGGASTGALIRATGGEKVADGVIRILKRFPLRDKLGSVALNGLYNNPCLPGETDSGRRNVYIDTETTGLSGGSGTLAFLVGIAVVEADAIALSQFLMTGFSAEAAALSAFAECLTADDRLVSYNGRSYDLPLLITRFRMQAMQHPFDGLPHLDLLHPVRRLFSKRWNDCRLISVEEKLLGFKRVDDLPGSEAPEAWFNYLRRGDNARLVQVVEHNQQDIISLAVAHSVLSQAVEQPWAFGVDLYALARWLAEHNDTAARELLQSHAAHLCDDGKRLLGRLWRRAGNWPQAIALWEDLAARGCTDSLERLAKYHEHISKDLTAARHCCAMLPAGAAYEHRRRRINAKLNGLLTPNLSVQQRRR